MKMIRTAGVALLLVTGFAHAEDIAWTATISLDGRTTVGIVDATEAGCNAQVAAYREVVVVQPCQPIEASRVGGGGSWNGLSPAWIQDNGDGSRGNGARTGGRHDRNPGGSGSSGGTAAGGGRAVGGAGNMGGGH